MIIIMEERGARERPDRPVNPGAPDRPGAGAEIGDFPGRANRQAERQEQQENP